MRHPLLSAALGLVFLSSATAAEDVDQAPIRYASTTPDDAVTKLRRQLRDGDVALQHDSEHGYLASLLRALDVPLSSQVLVFSKTSLQRARIGPKMPRAVYFNDDVTVGFCRTGTVLEIAASDPQLGTVFYTLDQNPIHGGVVTRQTESCLLCHGSSATQGFPGHLVRSVATDRQGELLRSLGGKRVDHTTPFGERWGGWYVTGTSGEQKHQGNRLPGPYSGDPPADGTNVTDLRSFFTVGNYLTPHSDLVALMVLEHQGEGHNRITRAGMRTRIALAERTNRNHEETARAIRGACEPLVEYLLFSGEARLTEPIAGTSGFAEEFAARGPFDSRGRSLRAFELKTRLFQNPLSYLIYSRAFGGLPAEARDYVYRRLWDILTEKDRSAAFAHLTSSDRQTILEILRETKADLPAYWNANTTALSSTRR